jgi:hypothetical protein
MVAGYGMSVSGQVGGERRMLISMSNYLQVGIPVFESYYVSDVSCKIYPRIPVNM